MQQIVIRLLHKNRGPARDDWIRMARVPDTSAITVTFTDKFGGRASTSSIRLVEHTALDYVDAVIQSIRYDNDAVDSLQFDFPGFPSVLYTPARLMNYEVRRAIRDMTRMVMESWFAEIPAEDEDSDTSSDTDSSDTSSESTESTDSDMPPLVPQSSIWSDYLQSHRLAAADELIPTESI